MKRIIIHGFQKEYRSFVNVVQRRSARPLLIEFENLLANQESTTNQIEGIKLKDEKEVFYIS